MKPNPNDRSEKPRSEQQQQQSSGDRQQQQEAGSGEGGQYGEGNDKATRDYDHGVKEHMKTHDVEREARDAAPRSAEEEREMDEAERKGRSRGRDDVEDDMARGGPSNPEGIK